MYTVCRAITAVLLLTGTAAAQEDFVDAVQEVSPSLATVLSTVDTGSQGKVGTMTTGIVASEDGYILTAYHTSVGFDKISVKLPNGNAYPATIHGFDALSGLALLKINANGLTPAEFADSDDLKVGQWVMSIGNLFGVEENALPGFSVGIIGGLHCSVPHAEVHQHNLIKTDAAMNPGCVGGPLVNTDGKIIGINIAICSNNGAWQGVGYAIPSNAALKAIEIMKTGRKRERGWLGVRIAGDDEVRITAIADGSPAKKAGLQVGDIIKQWDGHQIATVSELVDQVVATEPGTTVNVLISRDGADQAVPVVIEDASACTLENRIGFAKEKAREFFKKLNDHVAEEMPEKVKLAEREVREALQHYYGELKNAKIVNDAKEAIDNLPEIDLRYLNPAQIQKLREENEKLKERIEQLEKQLSENTDQ